jgi:hypothetical protein
LSVVGADVQFFSLQQGSSPEEILAAPFPITDLSSYTAEVHDAAAAMLSMDIVISVDSMTAHLAGALGKSVWVLLQYDADWRWLGRGRNDSPWYPTMRLFRQPHPEAWDAVGSAVARELQIWAGWAV